MTAEAPPPASLPEPGASPHPLQRPIRSFVLRAGRMGPGQQRALADLGPRFLLPYTPGQALDFTATFGRQAPRVLEIGFGMGHASAAYAAQHPQHDLLGLEVHPPGVGALLKLAGEQQLTNVRIIQHDAVEVLREMVPPASLAAVHIWFPDPWHKKRHHKRRLIQPGFVAALLPHLQPGGVLHCATDWHDYAEQMLAVLSAEPGLANTAEGYAPRPPWRAKSRFETRGERLGHGVWDLVFTRR